MEEAVVGAETAWLQLVVSSFFIGFVVSIDVGSLSLLKGSQFRPAHTRVALSIHGWSLMHALWHAGLLLLWTFAFGLLFGWIPNLAEWVRDLLVSLRDLIGSIWPLPWLIAHIETLIDHFTILLGLAVVAVVWRTYAAKLSGGIPMQQRLAERISIRIGHLFPGLKDTWLAWNMQAFVVAIDMLAISALLKAGDRYTRWWEVCFVAACVLFSVYAIAYVSSVISARHFDRLISDAVEQAEGIAHDSRRMSEAHWILLSLKILEAFLVFYFVVDLVVKISSGLPVDSPFFFLAAALLVAAIIAKHSFGALRRAVSDEVKEHVHQR